MYQETGLAKQAFPDRAATCKNRTRDEKRDRIQWWNLKTLPKEYRGSVRKAKIQLDFSLVTDIKGNKNF